MKETPTLPNIGPRQRRRRFVFGIGGLVAGAFLLTGLVLAHTSRGWRLLVAVPVWLAALGFLQYREKT